MRAVVLHEPGRAEVTEVRDPSPARGELIVRIDACGFCGTDLHIYDGEFSPTPYPIIPGHEFCGEVVALGAEVESPREGDFVAVDPSLFCGQCEQCRRGRGNLCRNWGAIGDTVNGAFAEYVAVPARNCYRLPDDVPRSWGTIAEPLSCALHGLDRLDTGPGDEILLYGAGTMGLLLGQLLQSAGARIDVVDRNPDRLPLAKRLFADRGVSAAAELDKQDWTAVVDATGAIPAIEDGLSHVARGGKFLVFGVAPAEATAKFSPFRIYNDEITIIGSMAVLHSFGRAVDLLAARTVDAEPIITHRLPLEAYDSAVGKVRTGEGLKLQLSPLV